MNVEQDSSSDDEISRHGQMLREALDTSMFSAHKLDSKDNKEQETCKNYKSNVLNVTPQFQKFVAKRLSKTLDEMIQEYQPEKLQFKSDKSSGILLFSNSRTLLRDRSFTYSESCDTKSRISSSRKKKVKRKPVEHDKNELTEMQKVQEVAVSAEWILNGECTRGWSEPKGKVFAYRTNENGILQEVLPH